MKGSIGMADAPERPKQTDENRPAAAKFSERPLDVDVRSSAGPYPRPPLPRRGAKTIWLAAAGAAVVLGLTWLLFKSGEEQVTPPPPLPPVSLTEPEPVPVTPGVVDFAPLPNQPIDQPIDQPEARPTAAQPARTAPPPQPRPASEPPLAKPASDEPAQAPPPAKPTDEPSDEPGKEQPTAESEKSEISDKWVVNIYSTPDATESLRFLSTLLGQDLGGRIYASEAILEGRLQHRIRVGFFDTREEAEAVGLKIKERYQLHSTPWAVQPNKEEESKFGGQ